MCSYSKIVTCFFVLFLTIPTVLFSQQYTRRQLSGLYAGHSGGIPMGWYGNMEVIGTPPNHYYKLYIRPWGRFVFKEKWNDAGNVRRFLFIKRRSGKWVRFRGKWNTTGDSLYLKYGSRHKISVAYKVEFYYDYKALGFWKLYKFGLRSKEHLLMKIWKGDE